MRQISESSGASETTQFQLMKLRRFGNNIGLFWRIVCYAGVLLALLGIWAENPHFYMTPNGWTALALAACYLAAYTRGSRWIAGGNPDSYWKLRFNTGRVLYPWRAVALWAILLALSVALIALNENFVWLIWIPFGMSFSMLPMPRSLALVIPTALLAMGFYHQLPTSLQPEEMLRFAGMALGFACYSAVIYMPIVLLRNRFQRERMFREMEQSHHELEAANHRLALAATQERELAVLRERGRLARDMHDTLGHSLALMTVKLEAAQRLRAVDPARADHEVAATQTIARDALGELRAAIANLRTSGGARECLCDALRHAAEESAVRAGWRFTCEIAPDVEPIDEQTCETLLRTGIEALANIERHASAHAVHLELSRQNDCIILRIEDDGVGILTTNPPQRVTAPVRLNGSSEHTGLPAHDDIISPSGHFGITGMRERMTGAGGSFTIGAGANGGGTCIEVRIPASSR